MLLVTAPDDYEDQDACKRLFAEGLLRWPHEPVNAVASRLFPMALAAYVVKAEWEKEPDVIAHRNELLQEFGEEFFMPTKFDVAREVYTKAAQCRVAEDAFKGYKLYAEIMGYISKGEKNNINVAVQNNVMTYPMAEDIDDWSERAKQQQTKLIDASASQG